MSRIRLGLTLAAVAAASVALSTGCRTPRRTVRVGSEAATVNITMTGLQPGDENNTTWLYELSGCVGEMNGVLGAGNVVSFTSAGIKKGLTGCQLEVRTLEKPPGIKFFDDPADRHNFYWARDFAITSDATGALVATVPLQQLYVVDLSDATQTFKLHLPVTFALPEARKPLTAALQCEPELVNPSLYPEANPTSGEFEFTFPLQARTEFTCTAVEVRVGGTADTYAASFSGAGFTFVAEPDHPVQAPALALQLTSAPDDDQGGVQVEVTNPQDCNADGKVFDRTTRTCKTVPAQ
jgi:hypothetical protein